MDIQKARDLYAELRDYLKAHYKKSWLYQYKNTCLAIEDLDMDISDSDKERAVRYYYEHIYQGRGSLMENLIWDNDYETRMALNAPIIRVKKELETILGLTAEDD